MQLKWRLSHARGYLELGMVGAAETELDHVPPQSTDDFEVRSLRALIMQEKKDWKNLAPLAERLVRDCPADPGWWIMWAYAVRRADSLASAEKILIEAEARHPKEATIQFNLGCYACQRGDLLRARTYVDCAIALDEQFKDAAEIDPDLAPLRELQNK